MSFISTYDNQTARRMHRGRDNGTPIAAPKRATYAGISNLTLGLVIFGALATGGIVAIAFVVAKEVMKNFIRKDAALIQVGIAAAKITLSNEIEIVTPHDGKARYFEQNGEVHLRLNGIESTEAIFKGTINEFRNSVRKDIQDHSATYLEYLEDDETISRLNWVDTMLHNLKSTPKLDKNNGKDMSYLDYINEAFGLEMTVEQANKLPPLTQNDVDVLSSLFKLRSGIALYDTEANPITFSQHVRANQEFMDQANQVYRPGGPKRSEQPIESIPEIKLTENLMPKNFSAGTDRDTLTDRTEGEIEFNDNYDEVTNHNSKVAENVRLFVQLDKGVGCNVNEKPNWTTTFSNIAYTNPNQNNKHREFYRVHPLVIALRDMQGLHQRQAALETDPDPKNSGCQRYFVDNLVIFEFFETNRLKFNALLTEIYTKNNTLLLKDSKESCRNHVL